MKYLKYKIISIDPDNNVEPRVQVKFDEYNFWVYAEHRLDLLIYNKKIQNNSIWEGYLSSFLSYKTSVRQKKLFFALDKAGNNWLVGYRGKIIEEYDERRFLVDATVPIVVSKCKECQIGDYIECKATRMTVDILKDEN